MVTYEAADAHRNLAQQLFARKRMLASPQAVLPLIVVAIGLFLTFDTDSFATSTNFQNLARQGSVLLIVAVGVAVVVLGRGIDLSVGSIMAFAGVLGALVARDSGSAELGLFVIILTGLLIGTANGIAVGIFRLSPLIVTLATLSIFRGIALWISDGASVIGMPDGFSTLGNDSIGVVPLSAIIAIAVLLLGVFILHGTRWGTYIHAAGSNPRAAALSGIRVPLLTVSLYAFSGLMAGLGSAILSSRINTGSPLLAQGFEFQVLGSVFLGGVIFLAGRGSLWGVFFAVVILTEIQNGLNLSGVSPFWQPVVPGAVLLAAVTLQRILRPAGDSED